MLTDGLGLIRLIYKLVMGAQFQFQFKMEVKMEDSDSELLKTHFLQGREMSLPQRKLNLNISKEDSA